MGNAGPTYHITRDFIFQSTPRHDLIYNPEYLEIVKRINLQPLISATDVLRQLITRYNNTCDKMDREWAESSRSNRFTRITAKGATVMEGVSTCKKLGLKLLELRTREEVSRFLKEINGGTKVTPAAIFYENKLRSFVFFSDRLPVEKESVIKKTLHGYDVGAYDTWDSYSNHFGKYLVDGAQIYLDFASANEKYDHFFCQAYEVKESPDVESCKMNFKFIEEVVSVHSQYVKELLTVLKQGYSQREMGYTESRPKRASALLAGAVGGMFGAISTELFSRISPDDKISAAAEETDRILDHLGERTSVLDVNQKRIYTLIEQIQRRLSHASTMVTYSMELSATHTQINSVLIHIGDHLKYLYRLLAGGATDQGINLALNEKDRNAVLKLSINTTEGYKLSPGKPIKHRFQMIKPNILCVVMDVPIKPPLKSKAAVIALAFPIIKRKRLWAFKLPFKHFLHFSGGYFVELNTNTFKDCVRDGSCSGILPLEYADDTAECHVGQYFGEAYSDCKHSHISKKRFLVQAGNKLAFAILKPLTVKIECADDRQNQIHRLNGRGIYDIPTGCKITTSKAILKDSDVSKIMIERNTSLYHNNPLNPPTISTKPFERIKINLKPIEKGTTLTKSGHTNYTSWKLMFTAVFIIILLMIIPWAVAYRIISKRMRREDRRHTTPL